MSRSFLDQTVKYVNRYLAPLGCMEITSSMVSNYVKKGYITNPTHKQYSADQIAYLFFISVAKSVLSMENIARLFDEAREFLGQVGLSDKAASLAGQLSHGEQRALELAMALATRPRLLLLDEPMAGTGPEESARMVELIEHLARHVTILLVEHDMAAVFRLADRISVLVNGRLICTGTPDDVKNHPDVRRAYLGDHL